MSPNNQMSLTAHGSKIEPIREDQVKTLISVVRAMKIIYSPLMPLSMHAEPWGVTPKRKLKYDPQTIVDWMLRVMYIPGVHSAISQLANGMDSSADAQHQRHSNTTIECCSWLAGVDSCLP
jgi:hypothetical protein